MKKMIAFLSTIVMTALILSVNAFAAPNPFVSGRLEVPNNSILFESGLVSREFGSHLHRNELTNRWYVDGAELIIPLPRNVEPGHALRLDLINAIWAFDVDRHSINGTRQTWNSDYGSFDGAVYQRREAHSGTDSFVGRDIFSTGGTSVGGTIHLEAQYELRVSAASRGSAIVSLLQSYDVSEQPRILRIPLVTFIENENAEVAVMIDPGNQTGIRGHEFNFSSTGRNRVTPTPTLTPSPTPTPTPTPTPLPTPLPTPPTIITPPINITPTPIPDIPYITINDSRHAAPALAGTLYNLRLLVGTGVDGTGAPNFELEQPLNRMEALTLVIRLMGLESRANEFAGPNPFNDTPDWGQRIASFAYSEGITVGVGGGLFMPERLVTYQEFTVFLLRTLGYSENNGDFLFEQALNKAVDINLYSSRQRNIHSNAAQFLRSDAVVSMVSALQTNTRNTGTMLIDTLVASNVITREAADRFIIDVSQIKRFW